MEEEKFAKAPRTTYIIIFAVYIAAGLMALACGIVWVIADSLKPIGWIFLFMGMFLPVMSVIWLIYFIRLPQYAITYKDGKLYFRNKLICTPAELENFSNKGGGLDGALLSFGRLFVWVHGKRYKFNYVIDVDSVVRRLFVIKAEYEVKQNIAQKTAEAGDENG